MAEMLQKNTILIILFINYFAKEVASDVFTAIDDVADLYEVEAAVIDTLKKYVSNQEQILDFVKKQITDYEREHEAASVNTSTYLQYPINAYLITKRLTLDLDIVNQTINSGKADALFQELTNDFGNKLALPSPNDLVGAATALTRLQNVYEFNIKNISNGYFNNQKRSRKLTADDIFSISYIAYKSNNYKLAIPWLTLTLEQLEDGSISEPESVAKLTIQYLAECYNNTGNIEAALKMIEKLLQLDPYDEEVQNNKNQLINLLKLQIEPNENSKSLDHGYNYAENIHNLQQKPNENDTAKYYALLRGSYSRLCSKRVFPTDKFLAQLKCRYITNGLPFLKIAPFKMEEISLDPYVATYYDVISDAEIEIVKNLSRPKMIRATVQVSKENRIDSDLRIGKSGWLADTEHKVIEDISKRVQCMTNLTMKYSEMLQVVNYGIGGQYDVHTDYLANNLLEDTGDRIATVLFYMSDVEEGGGTAFPIIGTIVWPRKGSAIFWYNLHKSGVGDDRTLHGGCPVFIGSKWIANKWIRLKDQEFIRPCDLYRDDPII